jgi:chemotaxis protein histidine kinase CheA
VEAGPAGPADFTDEGGRALLRWRGLEVPLVTLRGLLSKTEEGGAVDARAGAVVIARAEVEGVRHVAVAVDGVEGRRDVLVRGLGRHAARWRGVSGATELPDGAAALVLDLRRLLETRARV